MQNVGLYYVLDCGWNDIGLIFTGSMFWHIVIIIALIIIGYNMFCH